MTPWCQSGSPQTSILITYWFFHCCWLFNICLGSYGTYKIYTNNKLKQDNIKVLYICVSICFCISPPGWAFGTQAGWECWYNDHLPWQAINVIGLNGQLYGLTFLYLFFMLRAKRVFQNTALRIHKLINFIFHLGLSIQFITPIFITYFFLSAWDAYNRKYGLRLLNVFMWTNTSCSLLVLIVFIRQILWITSKTNTPNTFTPTTFSPNTIRIKMENSINSFDSSNNNKSNTIDIFTIESMTDTSKDNKSSFQYIDQDLLRVISRYLVCVIFATLSTLCVQILGVIRSEVPMLHSNVEIRNIHFAVRILDECVSLVCLSLQFPFGKPFYARCCGKIHDKVSNIFTEKMKLQVTN